MTDVLGRARARVATALADDEDDDGPSALAGMDDRLTVGAAPADRDDEHDRAS